MGNELNRDLSRRDFLKVAGATAGVAALASAGLTAKPTAAFAAVAPADMRVGTEYTATINLYVKHEDHQAPSFITSGPAYLTNPKNPLKLQGFPTQPVTDNATIRKNEDGTLTFTVPVVNPCFCLVKNDQTAGNPSVTGKTYTDSQYVPTDGDYNGKRIDSLTGVVTSQESEYTFDAANVEEYAAYPLKKGYHRWPIYMSIDFSTIH